MSASQEMTLEAELTTANARIAELEKEAHILRDKIPHVGARIALERSAKQVERLTQIIERMREVVKYQSERIKYLEGATNHATGTPLSKAMIRADALERELVTERGRLEKIQRAYKAAKDRAASTAAGETEKAGGQ